MNRHEEHKLTRKEMSDRLIEVEEKLLIAPTNTYLLQDKKNYRRWIKRCTDSIALARKSVGVYFQKAWDAYPPPPKLAKAKGWRHKKGSMDKAKGMWYDLNLDQEKAERILYAVNEFRDEWLKDQQTPLPHMYQWLKERRWKSYAKAEEKVAQKRMCTVCGQRPIEHPMFRWKDDANRNWTGNVCDECKTKIEGKYNG